jgi:hypothetical protein
MKRDRYHRSLFFLKKTIYAIHENDQLKILNNQGILLKLAKSCIIKWKFQHYWLKY